MTETWKDNTSRVPGTGGLAVASVSLCFLGLAVIAWRLLAYRPWWSEYVARNATHLLGIVALIFGLAALAGISGRIATIVLVVISSPLILYLCSLLLLFPFRNDFGYRVLNKCSFYLAAALLFLFAFLIPALATIEWKSTFMNKCSQGTLAIMGMVLGTLLVSFWWIETCQPFSTALGNACAGNLKRLGDAMKTYADEYEGRYPDPNQWCDLLLEHTDTDADRFLCPAVKWKWRRQVLPWPIPKNQRCYYAMNPDCEPNSPDDTVLLFEIAGGWNMSGGLELVTFENHLGRGGSVLVNGGYLPAVRFEELENLHWRSKTRGDGPNE